MSELPLARAVVDRAAVLRTDAVWLAGALADPATRVVLVRDGSVLTTGTGGGPDVDPWAEVEPDVALAVLDPVSAVALAGAAGDGAWLFLGRDGAAWFALRVPGAGAPPLVGVSSDVLVHARSEQAADGTGPPGAVWTSLRAVGAVLSARDAGLATTAVALDHWHRRHPRCPRCGGPTDATAGGWARVCRADGSEHYPRTDPSVIVAVVDEDDRLLLGHAAAWRPGRYSTLAGFVEAGEPAEAAVRREVAEETGVVVAEVEYVASQPWPFPGSLMLGFRARAQGVPPRPDGTELTDARWFTRVGLAAAVAAGDVVPPGRTSIARALVEDWFGGPLPPVGSARDLGDGQPCDGCDLVDRQPEA
ncbi:MAG: NAD(+) diphosphatase [Micrococcales bacterium]|nr:NAD(+) diphosphatase [Micrococcales bacterium]